MTAVPPELPASEENSGIPDVLQVPPPEILRGLVENQSRQLIIQEKQLALEAKKLDLSVQKDKHQFEWAHASLNANERDRSHQRDCDNRNRRNVIIFIGILVLLVLCALIGMSFIGAKDLALEVLKIVATAVFAGLGGYGIGRSQSASKEESDKSDRPSRESSD